MVLIRDKSFLRYAAKFLAAFCILYYGTIAVIGLATPGNHYIPFIDYAKRVFLSPIEFDSAVFEYPFCQLADIFARWKKYCLSDKCHWHAADLGCRSSRWKAATADRLRRQCWICPLAIRWKHHLRQGCGLPHY